MITFAVIMSGIAVWAITGSIVSVRRDGYRREPTRQRY
jgi:low affinity Fe/Cu permease